MYNLKGKQLKDWGPGDRNPSAGLGAKRSGRRSRPKAIVFCLNITIYDSCGHRHTKSAIPKPFIQCEFKKTKHPTHVDNFAKY